MTIQCKICDHRTPSSPYASICNPGQTGLIWLSRDDLWHLRDQCASVIAQVEQREADDAKAETVRLEREAQ